MSAPGPAAKTFRLDASYAAVNGLYQERGWTDGLPIVPPTDRDVKEFLRWTDRDPLDVVAVLPPRQGEATVERIAVNAVMAGCKPQSLPVIITAIEALADPAFNLDSIQATTHPVAPIMIVNGPVAGELAINSGYNAFGQGSPAKIAYCVAENEAESPWEPLHVEHGFPIDVSTVTVIGCEGPHNIQDHYSYTGLGVLRIIAGAMGQAGSNNLLAYGQPLLSLGPEHAATIAHDGYSKRQVKEFIFENARFPLGRLGEEYRRFHVQSHGVVDAPNTLQPIVRSPDDVTVIVVGGAGKHTC